MLITAPEKKCIPTGTGRPRRTAECNFVMVFSTELLQHGFLCRQKPSCSFPPCFISWTFDIVTLDRNSNRKSPMRNKGNNATLYHNFLSSREHIPDRDHGTLLCNQRAGRSRHGSQERRIRLWHLCNHHDRRGRHGSCREYWSAWEQPGAWSAEDNGR